MLGHKRYVYSKEEFFMLTTALTTAALGQVASLCAAASVADIPTIPYAAYEEARRLFASISNPHDRSEAPRQRLLRAELHPDHPADHSDRALVRRIENFFYIRVGVRGHPRAEMGDHFGGAVGTDDSGFLERIIVSHCV